MKTRLRVSYMVLGAVLGIITLFTQATPVEAFSFSFPNIPDIRNILIRLFPFPNLPPLKPLPSIKPLRPFQNPLASPTLTLTPTPVLPTETPMPTLTPVPTDTPTPTPTLTPVPTDTPVPTSTPTPTSTPVPTSTPTPTPTPTMTPMPTDTPTPTSTLTPTPTSTPTPPVSLGLVAYWKLNEGSGISIPDYSGNNRRLHVNNNLAPIWSTDVPTNSWGDAFSYEVQSTANNFLYNENLSTSDYCFPTAYTIEGWFKVLSPAITDGTLISKFSGMGWLIWTGGSANPLEFRQYNPLSSINSGGAFTLLDQWHHIAVVWDGSTRKWYIDGQLTNNDNYNTAPGCFSGHFNIGTYTDGASGSVNNMRVSEIRIYESALSQAQIIADAGFTAGAGSVVINEIMWAGSAVSAFDEWVELKNTTSLPIDLTNWVVENLGSSSSADIIIPTTVPNRTIAANSYYLIANYPKNNSIIDVDPDMVTASVSLDNSGEKLTLKNSTGDIIDMANQPGSWFAGTSTIPHKSMSRKNPPGDGTNTTNWFTSTGSVNLDVGATESASPKADNI